MTAPNGQTYAAHNSKDKKLDDAIQKAFDEGAKPGQILEICYNPTEDKYHGLL